MIDSDTRNMNIHGIVEHKFLVSSVRVKELLNQSSLAMDL
jgi:hypothetical protein